MKAVLYEFIRKTLDWVREHAPGMIAVGTWVYQRMARKVQDRQNELERVGLQKSHLENVNAVESKNAGKSDADIVADAVDEGGRTKK